MEWINIGVNTRSRDWTPTEHQMMRKATRWHGLRIMAVMTLVLLVFVAGYEIYGRAKADTLVGSLKAANTIEVPKLIREFVDYRRWTEPRLRDLRDTSSENSPERLHASLVLLAFDPSEVEYLGDHLLSAPPQEVLVLAQNLAKHKAQLIPRFQAKVKSAKPDDPQLLSAASALAWFQPDHEVWDDANLAKLAQAMTTVNPVYLGSWLDGLRPIRLSLIKPLSDIWSDKQRLDAQRSLATNILVDYTSDQLETAIELTLKSDDKSFNAFFKLLAKNKEAAIKVAQDELAKKVGPTLSEIAKDQLTQRQARAVVVLARLGQLDDLWPKLAHQSDPRLRHFLLNGFQPWGVDVTVLQSALIKLNSAPITKLDTIDKVLFDPITSQRRLIIMALGTYSLSELDQAQQTVEQLQELYNNDPDAGIHGAVEWTMRQWKREIELKNPPNLENRGSKRWFVNSQGQTFAVIEEPSAFSIGSPDTEPERYFDEPYTKVALPRRFAIMVKEVGFQEYERFSKELEIYKRYSPDPNGPVVSTSWFEAAAYCNWLSKQEGIPQAQWCYEPNAQGKYEFGMRIAKDASMREGYRLPTEGEWEYVCRAGTTTGRYYGQSQELLRKYAWYVVNSDQYAHARGMLFPNDLGLFDTLGNLYEWCQEPNQPVKDPTSIDLGTPRLLRSGAFGFPSQFIRSAYRGWVVPSYRYFGNGFRLIRTCR